MLLVEAVASLALARLALFFVPFKVLAARFGVVKTRDESTGRLTLSDEQQARAVEIGWAVTRAARYVPFRAVCLPQAIAAKAMMSRRRIASVMHFGVMRQPNEPLAAHAWLDANEIEVTGFPLMPECVEIARFL